MSSPTYHTAPIKTDGMPPGIPYIVGNEGAERFNFYGMRAVLFVFMTKYLVDDAGHAAPMTENEANKWYHLFLSANYFFPTLGAIVSDAFWGKYRTIFWLSLVYCLGSVVLALDHTRFGLTAGLTLIAIGAGGIKPCVSSHVGDQFGPWNQHLLARAFGWFYFSVNAGSSVSMYIVPILLAKYGAGSAFGLPAVLMLVAAYVFWSGRYKFAHIPPKGRSFLRETFNRDGFAALGRLALIFMFMIVFWALWDQSGSEWVAQAEKMDLKVFGFTFFSSQIQVVNGLLTLAFIPLFQYAVYPAINRVWTFTPLRKIGLGIFTIGLSFLVSAWIETQLAAGVKLNVMWQMPAYVLLTAGEVMASITALEFAYTQAPTHLKALVQALYLLSISAGNLFAAGVHWFIAKPDGTTKLTGSAYYTFYAVISIAAAVIFVFFALRYREKTYLQGEAAAAAAA
ncbi:MAG: POT family MFS transporter [Verrucomicrobia bacterium]|nr:POT family MFS transporter [Verrucomicrobiota bacterium]